MNRLPNVGLEDELCDVLGKALRGRGESTASLARQTGLAPAAIEDAFRGAGSVDVYSAIALALDLEPIALSELAQGPTVPSVTLPPSIVMLNTPHPVPGYAAMTVNNYVLFPASGSGEAIVFDTGADAASLLTLFRQGQHRLTRLFLTHTHHDHIAAYTDLVREFPGLRLYCPEKEPFGNGTKLSEGQRLTVGEGSIQVLEIAGHSPGGLIYLIDGFAAAPVAIVGDAIFCRSIGKVGRELYLGTLQKLRGILHSLPEATILCPGHGPVTTVAFEKRHNPFLAGTSL